MSTLRDLLSHASLSAILDAMDTAWQLARRLASWIRRMRSQGIYDVLSQERTVVIEDAGGEKATVETTQRVRFRQDGVMALAEYGWGEGDPFARYSCSPGWPCDRFRQGSRQVMLVSLRRAYDAGEELTFRSRREIVDGFRGEHEYWECDVYHRTGRIALQIIFPQGRRCQRATVTARTTGKTVALGAEAYHDLVDGRQALVWRQRRPKLGERYTIAWAW